jgi:hypothetical protein
LPGLWTSWRRQPGTSRPWGARPGWRSPAAITFGVIDEKVLNIGYTGVGPAFHGRGLAVVVQHGAHAAAARLAVERSVTENDEQNRAIRDVNAAMGYQVRFGYHPVASDLAAAAALPT